MGFFSFFNRAKAEQIRTPRRAFGMSGGTLINSESAMQASAFYRGVIYLSGQLAKLPCEIKNRENKILDSDISYFLNVSPNPEMTAFHFKLFMFQCAIIEGNGYAEIERTIDGRIRNLWPLNPKRVRPVRSSTGELFYEVSGFDTTSETTYLPPRDILIFRNIHTLDGIQGVGVVGYCINTLGISVGADKFANSLFANGGMPSGVLEHPGKLSDAAYKRLKDSWHEQQAGKKTGSTAILEEGVKYNPVSHSPDVLQFLESRKFNVLEIARFLGIPPQKLFDSDSAKYSNMEQAQLEVVTDTLDAWARNIEGEIDMKLLSGRKGGRRCELDIYAIYRGDSAARSTYYKNMMSTGSITPNEIRTKEGMAPYEGGDKFYIASNNFTSHDKLDAMIDAQIEKTMSEVRRNDKTSDIKEENEDENDLEIAARNRMLAILGREA